MAIDLETLARLYREDNNRKEEGHLSGGNLFYTEQASVWITIWSLRKRPSRSYTDTAEAFWPGLGP